MNGTEEHHVRGAEKMITTAQQQLEMGKPETAYTCLDDARAQLSSALEDSNESP